MRIIIATIKSWNIEHAKKLKEKYEGIHDIIIYTEKDEFNYNNVCDFEPDYILMPHWSYLVSEDITNNFECVVFHMTDLPYGRGGSPLQNLIVRGHKTTKISAIKVTKKLDGGPVYMKRDLELSGSAQEIFIRCSDVIFNEMIPCFLEGEMIPSEQVGEPVIFKRRKAEDGEITPDMDVEQIYDYIRMLDAEGYPRAFMKFGDYILDFENASYDGEENIVEAKVVFRKA